MLTSKEVLEKTGLSRATLNNYIASGILPRPDVLPPEPRDGAAPRIGYYPDDVVARIREIQRLKKEGWSLTRISEHFLGAFAAAPSAAGVSRPPARATTDNAPAEPVYSPKSAPALSQVAVLAADLQHSARLWCELPAPEYFELVDQVWLTMDPILRRHAGVHGRHPAEGLVGYFFPQPGSNYLWNALLTAHETRAAMRQVSQQWQLRKGWTTHLHMNIGIDEGYEWAGTLRGGARNEFTVLGAAVDHALWLSEFSRDGAIWATRNLIGRLGSDQRQRARYGVHGRDRHGRETFLPTVFSRVENLLGPAAAASATAARIARLAVAEIADITADPGASDRGSGGIPA